MIKTDSMQWKTGSKDIDGVLTSINPGLKYSGMVGHVLLGEAVEYGDLLFPVSTGNIREFKQADADAAATMPGACIALADGADATYIDALFFGYVKCTDWNLGTNASKALVIAEPPTAADTVTIGGRVYEFVADAADVAVATNVAVVFEDEATAKLALVAAINADRASKVTAAAFSSDDCTVTAKAKGLVGNTVVLAETFTHVSNIWTAGATALAGGVEGGAIYASTTPGAPTLTAPSANPDVVQGLGVAMTAEEIMFIPAMPGIVVPS